MAEHTAESRAPYLGIGIDQRRCAACLACPTVPCAVHRDEPGCTGASDCPSRVHEHGCYGDRDGAVCNDPDDHWHTDATRPGFIHPDDRPTLAELEADEHHDPFAGRARCRYGCRSTFITPDSPAALDHYTRVHGEQPPATDERSA